MPMEDPDKKSKPKLPRPVPPGPEDPPRPGGENARHGISCKYRSIDFGDSLLEEAEKQKKGISLPEDHVFGRPFVFISAGAIYYRDAPGEQRGLDITESDLDSVIAIFDSAESTCAIDWNHDEDAPIGHVVAMWKVRHRGKAALACLPAYDSKGKSLVGAASHLWSSPHIEWAGKDLDAAFGAADTGEPFGRMRIAHLAITTNPAQAHRALTAVRLSEGRTLSHLSEDENPSRYMEIDEMDELQKMLDELSAVVAAQGEQIAELRSMVEKAMGGESKAEEAEEAMDKDKGEDAEMSATEAALKAELSEMRKQLAQQREAVRLSERKGRIEALLSSKRLVKGEVEKAQRLFDKAPDLFAEIYEARPAGSALPSPKGHGQSVTVDLSDDANSRHKRALEIKASAEKAGKTISYVAALTQASVED